MNALVRRYAIGRPIQDRIALYTLWERLAQQHRDEASDRLTGRLPTYGRTALAFIREMRRYGVTPTQRGMDNGRRAGYRPPSGNMSLGLGGTHHVPGT